MDITRRAALSATVFAVASQVLWAAPWGPPYVPGFAHPSQRMAVPPGGASNLQLRLLEERADAYRIGIQATEPRAWRVRVYPQRGRVVVEAARQDFRIAPYGQAGSTARMRRSFSVPWDALPEQLSVAETNGGWEVSIPRRSSR